MSNSTSMHDAQWRAVLARDRGADGRFVFGVLSTGIYCRPSCPARRPLRGNVRFFADAASARAAGLRACQRCAPDAPAREEQAVAAALATIRTHAAEGVPVPPLAVLAGAANYAPSHFQRLFQRATGLSPAAYARALRLERARAALTTAASVTEAAYDAGYGDSSRFYAAQRGRLGMTPSVWAQGGRGVTIHWAVVATSLAPMLVAATAKGICRLAFHEGVADLAARFPHATLAEGDADFAALLTRVVRAVEQPGGAPGAANIPLDVRGTAFQEAVWRELARIPPGETRSYAELAAAAGRPKACRAAGSANGANPVAVLVPCHRVVRGDGSLGGYAYGTAIKQELLRREGARGVLGGGNPSRSRPRS